MGTQNGLPVRLIDKPQLTRLDELFRGKDFGKDSAAWDLLAA
jgi:hypothetical protein